ncbi:hypothetical protein NA647_00485 [Pseudomonas stutzeri]|uniref:hypothetical protein n=1 Tax=Stutzerimonas stutzeri TaxID=316 RepID=UPI0021093140|nr:hypothetical protein [Stutzerimonas stutzeri]MCQ4285913.1 hypothetical protein [Stutzerimonas stutzeri]
MANKPIHPSDNSDNSTNKQNPNKGTLGANRQHDQAQGNRGKQLNPNRKAAATRFGSSSAETSGAAYVDKR